ncbi:hypothetical protein DRN74_01020 [Candidatus Micrarchaeota archaeon]|nr:MAG: hypothetical protein DRN74_01020 [Candidatus Micrarchaeota archaeon]
MRIIGSASEYKKYVAEEWRKRNQDLDKAITTYLEMGGVLKLNGQDNTELIYPNKRRILYQIEEIKKKRTYIDKQLRFFERKRRSFITNNFFTNASRFIDPLYWQHILKINLDKEYRKSVDIVDPPITLMRDKKWRKMIKMFVNNAEYRERLKEARTSIIGKRRSSVRENAEKSIRNNIEAIDARIKQLREERRKFSRRLRALNTLLSWAK